MRIVCVSDTHNQLLKVKLPEGDLLLHSGDWTMQGRLSEVASFAFDLGLAAKQYPFGAVVIAGNHDFLAEQEPAMTEMILDRPKITYLMDSYIIINGFKIWGSPWQPWFCDWAFNLDRGAEIKEKWDLIPDDTDILITHGPPEGILDECPDGTRVGCEELFLAIERVRPKLHVFGHIHHSYGVVDLHSTKFVNASTCTERYKPTNPPIVVDL